MIIFIDESGDPGFKVNRGASRYFILSALVAENKEIIAKICNDPGLKKISSRGEMKFNKMNKHLVKEALTILSKYPIKIYILAIDKQNAFIPMRYSQASIYECIFFLLLKNCFSQNTDFVEIRLDGLKNNKFVSGLKVALRRRFNLKVNLRMANSRSDILIQFSDLIAGSVRRSYCKEKGDQLSYRSIIQKKIVKEVTVKKLDLVSILEPV